MLRVHPDVAKELKSNNGRLLNEMEELTKRTIIVRAIRRCIRSSSILTSGQLSAVSLQLSMPMWGQPPSLSAGRARQMPVPRQPWTCDSLSCMNGSGGARLQPRHPEPIKTRALATEGLLAFSAMTTRDPNRMQAPQRGY